jgi:hypothetical protein
MDTDRSYRRPLFDLVLDTPSADDPPIAQQPGAPLETLLAFYAPSRTPRFVLGRVNYRPPTDQLSARLAVASALMARGVHPRQSLPR